MIKDYIVFQLTPEGDKIDLGCSQLLTLQNGMDQKFIPSQASRLIQFGKIEIEEFSDAFSDAFHRRYARYDVDINDFRHEDGSPKLIRVKVIDKDKDRLVVKYEPYVGYVYYHNLLCYRGNNNKQAEQLVGQDIPVYFYKIEKAGYILFSQTNAYDEKRPVNNLEGLQVGQAIVCTPTNYVFQHGVFVTFGQGTGLIPKAEIIDWNLLHDSYPIGQPVQLIVKEIHLESNEISFWGKDSTASQQNSSDLKSAHELELGKVYKVSVLWVNPDSLKVSLNGSFHMIPLDLLPALINNNIIKLKENNQDFIVDAVCLERDGQIVLSVIDAIRMAYESLSAEERECGIKTAEVLYSETIGASKYFIIVRWKGLYGYLKINDAALAKQHLEECPQIGDKLDVHVIGYEKDFQLILRSKGFFEKKARTDIGDEQSLDMMLDDEDTATDSNVKELLSMKFDESIFNPNQVYEGKVVKSSNHGAVIKVMPSMVDVFIPLRRLYSTKDDYEKNLLKKDDVISVVFKGGNIFVSTFVKPIGNPPEKGDYRKLTVSSVMDDGIHAWTEQGDMAWIPVGEIDYKHKKKISGQNFTEGQQLDGYCLRMSPKANYLTVSLKKIRDVSVAYPIGTSLEGVAYFNLTQPEHYIVDLGDVWGDLDRQDISWNPSMRTLETNQCVKVMVVRKPIEGTKLSVSMLSPDVFGPIGSSLEGIVKEIDRENISIVVDGVMTYANVRKTQETLGIDNFGAIRLHVGDKVKLTLEYVNVANRIIRVKIEEIC